MRDVLHTDSSHRLQQYLPDDMFAVKNVASSRSSPLPLQRNYQGRWPSFDPISFLHEEGTTDQDGIERRQQFIADYQRLEVDSALGVEIEKVMLFAEGHFWLNEPIYDAERSKILGRTVHTPRIELLFREDRQQAEREIQKLLSSLRPSAKAARAYGESNRDEPLGEMSLAMTEALGALPKISQADYMEPRKRLKELTTIGKLTAMHHALIDLSGTIKHLEMTPGVIAGGHQLQFRGIRQLRFEQDAQSPITLDIGQKAVALTGKNGAGKTFAVEAMVEAMQTVSSTGYVRGELQIPVIKSLSMLARPAGGHKALSAFGTEVREWAELFERLERSTDTEGSSVVVSDEPFSSTDTEGQSELLAAFLRRLRELGARAIITTHADVSGLTEQVDLYHLSGNAKHRQIEPGLGDAQSLRVAVEHGFPAELIARAEAFMQGAIPDLALSDTHESVVSSLSDHYGAESPGMNWLYNQQPAEYPYSTRERWRAYSARPAKGSFPYDTVHIYGKRDDVLHYWGAGWIGQEVADGLQAATNNPEIIAERQVFIQNLANYEDQTGLTAALADFQSIYAGLSKDSYRYTGHEHMGSELADPLENISNTLYAMMHMMQKETGRNDMYAGYRYSKSKEVTLAKARAFKMEVLSRLATIILREDGGASSQAFAKYYEAFALATITTPDANNKVPADDLREACYAYLDAVDNAKIGRRNDRAYQRQKFDEIFYEWELDDDGWPKFPPVNTGRWRSTIHSRNLDDIRQELTLREKASSYSPLPQKIVELATATMTVDGLRDNAEYWENIYELCQRYSDEGVVTPIKHAAAVLNWVAQDIDPVATVAGHLHQIGGTIAEDLARHFETTVASYFDRKPRSSDALPRIEKARKKPGDDSLWRICRQPAYGDALSRHTEPNPYMEAGQLLRMVDVAQRLTDTHYTLVEPALQPEFTQARALLRPTSLRPFSVKYTSQGGIELLTGANGSGKTEALRTMFGTVASAQATGFVPGEAKLPIYDKIIYIDRPVYDTVAGKSSFTADVDNWQKTLLLLEDAAPSIVFADEPFSTAPAKYQEALLLAVSEWLSARGHRFVVATHNHAAVNRLQVAGQTQSSVELTAHHFKATVEGEGMIAYTYELHDGQAPSDAIAVALTIGGDSLRRALGKV